MRRSFPAGAWKPDLAPHSHDGLLTASGVVPGANGYKPIGQFEAVSEALAGFSGAAAFLSTDGTSFLLAGDATDLYRLSAGTWASVLGSLSAGNWQFAQFRSAVTGSNIAIGVHGGAPVKYDLDTATAAVLGGTPPDASFITVAGDFVVLSGNQAENAKVWWSGIENAEIWTSGTSQSGYSIIPDDGAITGLSGYDAGFLAFQRSAISRFAFQGPPVGFSKEKISSGVGCIASGSIARAGSQIYFLSERGFMVCDGSAVAPFAHEVFDATFFAKYSRSELEGVTAAVDPRQFLYMFAMPGQPGRIWIYNWVLQRGSYIDIDLRAVFPGFTANVTLEELDALYPGGIDSIPYSLDSPIFQGGEPRLYVVSRDGTVGTLTGTPSAAEFAWPYLDIAGEQRARVFNTRPVTDCVGGMTLSIDAKARLGDATAETSQGELRASGDMPIRCNGRHLKPRVRIEAGQIWTYFQGLDVEFGIGGKR